MEERHKNYMQSENLLQMKCTNYLKEITFIGTGDFIIGQ